MNQEDIYTIRVKGLTLKEIESRLGKFASDGIVRAMSVGDLFEERDKLEIQRDNLLRVVTEAKYACPADDMNWEHPDDCDVVCSNDSEACWLLWAATNQII